MLEYNSERGCTDHSFDGFYFKGVYIYAGLSVDSNHDRENTLKCVVCQYIIFTSGQPTLFPLPSHFLTTSKGGDLG